MSLAKRIYELQQVEQSIQTKRKELDVIELAINRDEAYERAKAAFDVARDDQKAREKQYKEHDAEAEEIRTALQNINAKLYGGKIKNPKELVGYDEEAGLLKARLAAKDDVLLDMMEIIDGAKIEIRRLEEACAVAENEWDSRKPGLIEQAGQLKENIAVLQKQYEEILGAVDKATLTTYEGIKGRKNQAVVRVEQGRCLGCRMTLSISELQRVRGNDLVTCSNCGRILYLS
jgi:predicted  nucleic acid-binding Zn-ribbon protein